ncbi:hypothetical protein ES705_10501 [subsurface metagenome]
MRNKILLLSLIALLVLPVACFTGDVEITDVKVKWMEKGVLGRGFRAQLWVRNTTRKNYRVFGRLVFYDKGGYIVCTKGFYGDVKAGESEDIGGSSHLWGSEYRDQAFHKAAIDRKVRIKR